MFVCSDTDYCEGRRAAGHRRRPTAQSATADGERMADDDAPLLVAEGLTKCYGRAARLPRRVVRALRGEVLAVVGESGSGKTTLLQLLSAQLDAERRARALPHARRRHRAISRRSARRSGASWCAPTGAIVHQDPALGLRMAVSAGANVGERLMAVGWRHYGRIRGSRADWLERVEIDADRIDDAPRTYSGGMRQRLQIARNLVTAAAPRLHGRADRRARRLGAGAAARPDARAGRRARARRRHRDPRSRCRAAVVAPRSW